MIEYAKELFIGQNGRIEENELDHENGQVVLEQEVFVLGVEVFDDHS